jgi:hypothetical protein
MEPKGFFGALFDVSFTSFVTTRIIKVIYVITLVLIGLTALVFVVAAFDDSVGAGIFVLVIAAPLLSLLYVIYARVLLELVIAIFRIMEHTGEQVALLRGQAAPAAAAPPTIPQPPPPSPPQPPQPPQPPTAG